MLGNENPSVNTFRKKKRLRRQSQKKPVNTTVKKIRLRRKRRKTPVNTPVKKTSTPVGVARHGGGPSLQSMIQGVGCLQYMGSKKK